MALKRKIDEKTWEKLGDDMKPLYKKKGDDYVLDVEGDNDGGEGSAEELRRALDRVREDLKEVKKENKTLKDQLEEGSTLDAKKRGDIETLEKSWKDKLTAKETELTEKLSAKDKFIRDSMLDSAAKDVAAIAKSPTLLMPHVKSRLDVDLSGDVPVVRVLDANGKPSAASLEDLKKEFVANKDFSDIIVASKASGGAAKNNGESKTSGLGTPQTDATKPLAALKPHDLAATIKAKKDAAAQS